MNLIMHQIFADGTVWKNESNSRRTDSKYIIFEAENHHVMLSTILIVKNRFKKYKNNSKQNENDER